MSKHYITSEEKYKNNKDTAFCLLLIGIIGLAALIFVYFKFISDTNPGFSTIFRLCILLLLFSGLIFGGIISLLVSKKYKAAINTDETNINEIENFLLNNENLAKKINSEFSNENFSEEELYLARNDALLNILTESFPNSDETLLEELIETYYDQIF